MKKDKLTKKQVAEIKKEILEKYTIFGLWQTMCGYIVLLFVKELLIDNYLINFSIDVLVAIVAFYITLHNLVNQYKLINEYNISKKPFIFQIFGYIVGLFIVIITLKSPFDISFAILVIAFLTNKKLFEKELDSIKIK
ncbi:MAG: hypothetical protein KHX14_00040 [[Clostridium] spiroforme]|uniref:Uncharacterized protein n=1 Tax=Thomasclavelia spiroformis TaxID=29348 RepID=A0A943EMM6_9FIRM|nr:hypothetical protein [Thomasclavelia spiroformis]MBS5587195.1 hypothetical protein [Thomasclavelia spiroformis]